MIFYVVYQQFENYVIYPRVMSRSVDIPGSVIVIAALVGAAPAGRRRGAAGDPDGGRDLLLVREVFVPAPGRRASAARP